MAPLGTLYTYPNNYRVLKILAAARINNLTLTIPTAPEFTFRSTNEEPAFLARFPFGKVPTLALPDGTSLFESDAIAQYVAESGPHFLQLLGTSPFQRAAIRQWISFTACEFFEPAYVCSAWRGGWKIYDEARETRFMAELVRALGVFESALGGGGWLVECPGGKLSLADLSAAGIFAVGLQFVIDGELRARFPKCIEWYRRVVGDESVRDVFGEIQFVETRKAVPVA